MRLSRPDFSTVTQDHEAQRVTSPHFSVIFSPKAHGVAVVVSKKVSKSSIGRHILKRRTRAAAREWYLKHQAGALLIYLRAGSESLTFADISNELATLLARVA